MSTFIYLRTGLSSFLLAATAYLIAIQSDWWIYGIIMGVSGFINLAPCPQNSYWRFVASLVIVFGTLEAAFLVWTFQLLENAPLLNVHHQSTYPILTEGQNIFLVAAATSLSISSRITSLHCKLFDFFRAFLLLGFLTVCGYSGFYGFRFLVPDIVTHAINAVQSQ